MEGVACATVLGVVGDWGYAIPHSAAAGALATTGKKLTERLVALCFFCTPAIPYASKLATVGPGTKKALKRCLRAFFFFCGERGIRTPGTVTRTSV